jgi:hypothetical protein
VQSKPALAALLTRIDIPQSATEIIHSTRDFAAERPFPYFVKTPFGTASAGVWRIDTSTQRDALSGEPEHRGAFERGVVVQAAANGPLGRTQAVFDHGRLVAIQIYRQIVAGPGGGDVLKASVRRPNVCGFVKRIGAALNWHGALSFDYILNAVTGAPQFDLRRP